MTLDNTIDVPQTGERGSPTDETKVCRVGYAERDAKYVDVGDFGDDAAALINDYRGDGAISFVFGPGTYLWGETVTTDAEGITITTTTSGKQWPRIIVDVGAGNYAISLDFHSHYIGGMRWVPASGRLLEGSGPGGYSSTLENWRVVGGASGWDGHVIDEPGFSNVFRDIRVNLDGETDYVVKRSGFMNTFVAPWWSGFAISATRSVGSACTWISPNMESRADKTGVVAEAAMQVSNRDESWLLLGPNFERMLDTNGNPAAPGLRLGDPNASTLNGSRWGRGVVLGGQSTDVTHGIAVRGDARQADNTHGVRVTHHDFDTRKKEVDYGNVASGHLHIEPFSKVAVGADGKNRVLGRYWDGRRVVRTLDGSAKYAVGVNNSGAFDSTQL